MSLELRFDAARGRAAAAIAICAVTAGFALSGCGGSTRSVAAVCKVWDTEGLALHDKFAAAANSEKGGGTGATIAAIIQLLGAPNDLAHLMRHMGQVAPLDAADDFTKLADTFDTLSKSEGDSITHPLQAIGSNIAATFSASGSFDRVNSFLGTNCGIPGEKAPTNPN